MEHLTEFVSMPDGVRLATDVYLPDNPGRYPALLLLTPYGRKNLRLLAEWFVPSGYAVVIQDVRGRYDSEGDFDPVHQEKTDGPLTVDWIGGQAWYEPEAGIGIVGISYLATVGFAVAAQRKAVRAMINVGGLKGFYDISHRQGSLVLHHSLPWTIITSFSPQPSLKGPDWKAVYRTLPLTQAARAAGHDNPLWRAFSGAEAADPYWERLGVTEFLSDVDLPVLHVSGWYDLCLGSTLELYSHFAGRSSRPQHLVLGPWSHNGIFFGPTDLQGVDFGPDSRPGIGSHVVQWFDRWLKGTAAAGGHGTITDDERSVACFITGKNAWLHAPAWPPPAAGPLEILIAGPDALVGPGHGGTIAADYREYVYDPDDPAPTLGGAVWEFPDAGLQPGPADQTPLHRRGDVFVFSTPPLARELVTAGPVSCRLFVETSAPVTDFTAKLLDMGIDGTSRWIADGIVRGHFSPGRLTEIRIDLWAAGHAFREGHRVGLEVSSSSFPKWDRGLNTLTGCPERAIQRIRWGGSCPSGLLVHVVDGI